MQEKPNILWYCTDQQRYDTINALGNKYINTPKLNEFLKSSVGFTQAYVQSPVCTPSRASFLTGRYPASHHVNRNGNEEFPNHETLVTKIFADSGYRCGLVGKLHLAGAEKTREKRCNDGYSYYQWSHHPYPDIEGNLYTDWLANEKGQNVEELFNSITGSYGVGLPEELHQTTWCSEKAIDFITEKRSEPWLLSVNPFSPHPTFHPPGPYLDHYIPSEMPSPLFKESDIEKQKAFSNIDQQTVDAINPLDAIVSKKNNKELPKDLLASLPPQSYNPKLLKACYYAEIELVDKQFGRIIETLEETGQLDNTIIIFTSDHGELLGDHGLLFKGCRFFEALVHVPLIISWPKKWQKNRVSHALVESIDIAPTILEAAGIEIPYYIQGKSLYSLLEGTSDLQKHKDSVLCEYNDAMGQETTANKHQGSHGTMVFDGEYKSIVYSGEDIGEIYNLKNDPGEFDNLWDNEGIQDLKLRIIKKHLDKVMQASSAGIKRTKAY